MDQRNRDFKEALLARAESLVMPTGMMDVADYKPDEIKALLHDLQVHQIELELQNEELRQTHSVLLAARDKYARLYDFAPVGYCTLDRVGIILDCNHSLSRLLGRGRDKLLRTHINGLVVTDDLAVLNHLLKKSAHRGDTSYQLRLKGPDQTTLHCQLHLQSLEPAAIGEPALMLAISDVSRLHEITMDLKLRSTALGSTLEGVIITDRAQTICYVNRAFEETTGYSGTAVLGKTPHMLQSGKHSKTFYREMWSEINNTGCWRGEIWNRRASGEVYPEWLSISTIYDEWHRPIYYVGVFSDITHEENVRRRLHQLAYFDGVTGLPNRHLFMDRLKQELTHARRTGSPFTLLFMDLDRFKTINDTMGHSAGDMLLQAVGERLRDLLRENDTIARMGGDEFMVLLPGVDSGEDVYQVTRKILAHMAEPFVLDGRQYHIGISIGISGFPEDGRDEETLIKHADIAMYKAKDSGRNTFHKYSDRLNERLSKKVSLENELRHALKTNQLGIAYQPQFDLESGYFIGVEALMRWLHPQNGPVSPDEFIAVAEESGLIIDLGYWVLRNAASQYISWRELGMDVGRVSINLSPQQFLQSNLVDQIDDVLQQTGMPARALTIEITESAAMPNFGYSIKTLEALRDMGLTISIDDFGTGFSSLSQLRHLPIDALKIDRQFIDEIPHNADDVAITQAIISMAQSLNLQIIAEGVETESQARFLKTHACPIAQGFYYARPMPANEIPQLSFMPLSHV